VDAVFAEGVMDMVTVRTLRHRLVYRAPLADPDYLARLASAPLDGPDFSLYALEADPQEQVDVHLDAPQDTARLRDALLAWRQGLAIGDFVLPASQVSPGVARSLQQHGYWGDPGVGAPDPGASSEPVAAVGSEPPGARKDHLCLERFDFLPTESPALERP
jgi:hypothetical protein